MADEMDTCEYIWNHEMAMRRLLSLLRTGQSYCTDAECLDLPSGGTTDTSASGDGDQFLMTFVVMAVAAMLLFMRPSSRRAVGPSPADDGKPSSSGGSGDGSPPPPAPPAIH